MITKEEFYNAIRELDLNLPDPEKDGALFASKAMTIFSSFEKKLFFNRDGNNLFFTDLELTTSLFIAFLYQKERLNDNVPKTNIKDVYYELKMLGYMLRIIMGTLFSIQKKLKHSDH